MRLPPLVARVGIRTPRRSFAVWVPLFLVWLAVLLLALPVALVALAVVAFAPRWRFGRLAGRAYLALCAARGTDVEVEGEGTAISIALR